MFRLLALALFTACVVLIGTFETARGSMRFTRPTDTIAIAGNVTQSAACTYEAVIEVNSTSYTGGWGGNGYDIYGGSGLVFNFWAASREDEVLTIANNGGPVGGVYPITWPQGQPSSAAMATLLWYDLAFVYDGTQERLYLNGSLVGATNTSGRISSGAGATGAIGAIYREALNQSFLGEIRSLRISNTARYSGSSYTATTGSFSNDASTQLLYNFDTAPVAGKITDLSGNGHTGTLGAGFSGATSPTFIPVPEPTTLAAVAVSVGGFLMRRRSVRRL